MKGWLVIRPRQFPVSFRIDRRVPPILLALGLIALTAITLDIAQGEYAIPPLDVLKTLVGIETNNQDYSLVVNTLRLPRVLAAFLVGIGLATSGSILQGLTRNPLADPGIIGITSGASLAAVILIVLFPSITLYTVPFAAFGGAVVVAAVIYFLAFDKGSSPIRLILVGIGIAAITSALTSLIITFGEINTVGQALIWMTGSVYGRNWGHVWSLLPWLVIFVPLTLLLSRDLNALNLGDDVAQGLGNRVEWQRGLLLLISVALAGASVATAGTVTFVGLIAPHLARQLVGPSHEGLLPTAAIVGGVIVVLADLIGRMLFAPIELPCGIITAIVGAPYFLYLLYRNRNQS
ncbi:MAG: iron ABC transporter permease [Aphanothece sp. CMT-3BRIN-NPC111]|nr:iron ABC transporter permease [Aphanothece sp. CMT-3BRIN-NPC111]